MRSGAVAVAGALRFGCLLFAVTTTHPELSAAGMSFPDANCDGRFVVAEDIEAVVTALFDGSDCPAADANMDGRLNAPDIDAVLQRLDSIGDATRTPTRQAPSPTPTPTAGDEGPGVSFLGLVNADGCFACDVPNCNCAGTPTRTPALDDQGRRVFAPSLGRGFLLVVEARPGSSLLPVGMFVPAAIPNSPQRPDLQIQSNQDLGDGSTAICDHAFPAFGGVPGIDPPTFEAGAAITDALIDFACRFEVLSPNGPCTLNGFGVPAVLTPGGLPPGSLQFCLSVAAPEGFAEGRDTLLTVRLRDVDGNVGPPAQIVVRVGQP